MRRTKLLECAIAIGLLGAPPAALSGEHESAEPATPAEAKAHPSAARAEKAEKPWRPWTVGLVYGRGIMTPEERRAYRAGLRRQKTDEQKLAYWQAHVAAVQQRAIDIGIGLPDPPRPPDPRPGSRVYARHLMTLEEREEYRETWANLETREERLAFEAAHEKRMKARAEAWSIVPPKPRERYDLWDGIDIPKGMALGPQLDYLSKRLPMAEMRRELKNVATDSASDPEDREDFEKWLGRSREGAAQLEDASTREKLIELLDELETIHRDAVADAMQQEELDGEAES